MKRLQFEISEEMSQAMHESVNRTGLSTMSELLKQMLALYQWATEHAEQGHQLIARGADGRELELAMPPLTYARRAAQETK